MTCIPPEVEQQGGLVSEALAGQSSSAGSVRLPQATIRDPATATSIRPLTRNLNADLFIIAFHRIFGNQLLLASQNVSLLVVD